MPSERHPLAPAVAALADRVGDLRRTVGDRPVLVALDGRSGSGKTELATSLTGHLERSGIGTATLHLDDLYPGWTGLAGGLKALCSDVLAAVRQGRTGRYTSWDWYADRPGPVREVPAAPVVVVEGVGSSACRCADVFDLVVWVDAPSSVRRARALERDGQTFVPHWEEWAAQEDAVLGDAPPAADVVVDGVSGDLVWATLDP